MSVFSSNDFDGHEAVVFHNDPATGLKAIVGIHNTNLGPALGGCRMWPYENEDEAVIDVLRLSKGMTYKAALAGLDYGGGKAVIIGDPRTDKTEALLRAMGRFVQTFAGRYQTAEDVGMTVGDMDMLRKETPYAHGISNGSGNPSPATAYGVYRGIVATIRHRFGTSDLAGRTVAVQGMGSVGSTLCRYLADAGAKLVVADIDPDRVRAGQEAYGATAVATDDIHRVEADVFAPCALGAAINDRTLEEIQAVIVAGSANNQLAEPRHGIELAERGILYAPDYVINAGGLIDVAAEGPDYNSEAVLERVAGIEETLVRIFARAEKEGAAPEAIADRMAEERFLGATREAA